MIDPDYDLFLQVVEAGSISGAGRGRGLSAAAVSKRLARLEKRLGARLVNRTTRRLDLTPLGRELVRALLPVRQALLAVEERIAGRASRVGGLLRITAPTSFGRMHLAPSLATFVGQHSELELTLDLTDQFVDLMVGNYDVAVRVATRIDPGLVSHRLASSHRVLCASPEYLASRGEPVRLQDLSRHQLLAAQEQLPWQLHGPNGHSIVRATSYVSTNSSEVVRELALGGVGIALRSLWDVAAELEQGKLRRVLSAYEGSRDAAVMVVHPPAPVLPANLAALIDHLAVDLVPRLGSGVV